jgi:hypothetical protein
VTRSGSQASCAALACLAAAHPAEFAGLLEAEQALAVIDEVTIRRQLATARHDAFPPTSPRR